MKTLKNKKAFTLVELIVVIAIIGILSAVLIPSITGYIAKAKDSAALQEANFLKLAYVDWTVEKETTPNLTFDQYLDGNNLLQTGASLTVKYTAGSTESDDVLDFKDIYYTATNDVIIRFVFDSTTKTSSLSVATALPSLIRPSEGETGYKTLE